MGSPTKQRRMRRLFAMQAGLCAHCGQKVMHPDDRKGFDFLAPHGPTVDHAVARSKGGNDHISNLLLTHRRCNDRRGDGPLPLQAYDVWLRNLDLLQGKAA